MRVSYLYVFIGHYRENKSCGIISQDCVAYYFYLNPNLLITDLMVDIYFEG
jgi:hypothetical protein